MAHLRVGQPLPRLRRLRPLPGHALPRRRRARHPDRRPRPGAAPSPRPPPRRPRRAPPPPARRDPHRPHRPRPDHLRHPRPQPRLPRQGQTRRPQRGPRQRLPHPAPPAGRLRPVRAPGGRRSPAATLGPRPPAHVRRRAGSPRLRPHLEHGGPPARQLLPSHPVDRTRCHPQLPPHSRARDRPGEIHQRARPVDRPPRRERLRQELRPARHRAHLDGRRTAPGARHRRPEVPPRRRPQGPRRGLSLRSAGRPPARVGQGGGRSSPAPSRWRR